MLRIIKESIIKKKKNPIFGFSTEKQEQGISILVSVN